VKSVLELLTEERRIRVMETGSRFNGEALIGLGSELALVNMNAQLIHSEAAY
jgi:hypothetical protein